LSDAEMHKFMGRENSGNSSRRPPRGVELGPAAPSRRFGSM
jgi:hypothetical protein